MATRPRRPALTVVRGDPPPPLPPLRYVEHGPAVKPTWIDAHHDASLVWDELAPASIAHGLLTGLTTECFAHLCIYLAAFRRDRTELDFSQRSDMRELMNAYKVNRSALTPSTIGGNLPRAPHTQRHLHDEP